MHIVTKIFGIIAYGLAVIGLYWFFKGMYESDMVLMFGGLIQYFLLQYLAKDLV